LDHFEWYGPVLRAKNEPHFPGVLFDEHPHRAFLLAGTREHLYLTDVQLLPGFRWEAALRPPKLAGAPLEWLRSKLPGWVEREEARIAAFVRERLLARPPIRIAMHPHGHYRGAMEEDFPGVELL